MFLLFLKILVFSALAVFCVAWFIEFIEGGATDAEYSEIEPK